MYELLFITLIVLLVITIFLCYFSRRFREVWCWNSRVKLDTTWAQIYKNVRELTKEEKIKARAGNDEVKVQEMSPLNKKTSLDATLNKNMKENEELKFDKETNQYYVEGKWVTKQYTSCGENLAWLYNMVLLNSVVWIVLGSIFVIVTTLVTETVSASFKAGINSYLVAFTALFSVLISLLFQTGIEKNKQNKHLFQALCGDVKAMAMWVSALTNDKKKYKYTYAKKLEDGNPDTKSDIIGITARNSVELEFAKIRLLLSVCAPVAKHVLRDAPKDRAPDYDQLDDKLRLRFPVPNGITACLVRTGFQPPIYTLDKSQVWKNSNNPVKQFLYKKIKKVYDSSTMDLFEVVMYCLLDSINALKENNYIDNYGKERDLIAKWQDIYGSWGPMSSLTTYSQPDTVHVTILTSLLFYVWGMTVVNKHDAYTNFNFGDNGDDHSDYSDWRGEGMELQWINIYVICKTLLQIFPFTWFWFLSRRIGKPFKRGYPDADIISKDARDTQRQVSKLLSKRACIDVYDIVGFKDSGYDKQLAGAFERNSIKTGVLWAMEGKEDQVEEPVKSKQKQRRGSYPKGITLPNTNNNRRRLRYKNVNF